MLSEDGYHLHDIEAVSFIPFLINKVGCATQTHVDLTQDSKDDSKNMSEIESNLKKKFSWFIWS